jgi:hypothetical protein
MSLCRRWRERCDDFVGRVLLDAGRRLGSEGGCAGIKSEAGIAITCFAVMIFIRFGN